MRTVAAVVLPIKMAPLDFFGPIQAFNVAFATDSHTKPDMSKPLYRVITLGSKKGPVPTGLSGTGPEVVVEYDFSDDVDYDILLIPGGIGTRKLVCEGIFIDQLKTAAEKAKIIATVCTGAALLARTGMLEEKEATTNKSQYEWVTKQGPARWTCPPRWVKAIDSKSNQIFFTSGGVSAGIDMTLALIKYLDGKQVAHNAATIMEYKRIINPHEDPFACLCPAFR